MNIKKLIRNLIKMTPISKLYLYRYNYNFTPSQLCFLVSAITDASKLPGIFLEIGCAYGNTTIFLNKHIDYLDIEKNYICIDTFDGFTEADIEYEVIYRNKNKNAFTNAFLENSKQKFDETMTLNNISRVISYQSDINDFMISNLGKISFCLFDVDLYLPTIQALPKLYESLVEGGLIVVDDCMPNNSFDGAYQAYIEFCNKNLIKPEIVQGKLGLIRK